MSLGLEIRAQIDSENAKSLLLINGGAAVALLAFLPSILGKTGLEPVSQAVLCALCAFLLGLAAAFTHNRLRRICSMIWEGSGYQPARCHFLPVWISEREPCVCFLSTLIMWLSLFAFIIGGSIVAYGGFNLVGYKDRLPITTCWQLQELQGKVFRVNSCTGSFELAKLPDMQDNHSVKAEEPEASQP